MAELTQEEDREGRFPERGRVKNVANKWRVFEDGVIANQMQNEEFKNKWAVYEDGAMAHVMQQEEFEHKYGMNRYHRRTVREDIPVARIVQSAEEEERQRKEMLRLERQKMIADEDARLAREMAENLMLQEDNDHLQRQLEDEERTRRLLEDEDESLRQDEELARQLQQREKEKFERKKLERERRKLEQQIANERVEAERLLAAYKQEVQAGHQDNQHNIATETLQNGAPPDRLLRVDGKVEDLGDFTDFYNIPETEDEQNKKVIQQLQDEELARLLQEQEHKRGGHLKLDKLKAIEAQDAELARVMQEQEKLKEKKRKQKRLAQKQMSERRHHSSGGDNPSSIHQRSQSLEEYQNSSNLHPAHRDMQHGDSLHLQQQHGDPLHLQHLQQQHGDPRHLQQQHGDPLHPQHLQQQHGDSLHPQHLQQQHGDSRHLQQRESRPHLDANQLRDPRDEDLYEQPWTSIPRMQAPPLPAQPPPAMSHDPRLNAQEEPYHHHHQQQHQQHQHQHQQHQHQQQQQGYVAHNHPRQASRDSYDSQQSAGSPGSPPGLNSTNSSHEGPTTYKPLTSSPSSNLFMDLDPTVQRPAGQEPEPQQPLPDVQLSTQRTPATEEDAESPRPAEGRKATEWFGYGEDELTGTGGEEYAEVGDFAPVAGQRRNTMPKKGKEKKPSGKNKNGNCKQQ